ncbi:DUF29 family protein [Anabaena sp. FACHB-1237]|nr:DUF29 family protein [Anabaena sp. FACHB-1237]
MDFHLWLEQTAILLKERKLDQLDIENLLEEIEAISPREKDTLESNLTRVLHINQKKVKGLRIKT